MSKRFYSKKSEKLASEALDAYRAGREETDVHKIRLLEEKLRNDHTDIKTRCTLLGFYCASNHGQSANYWFMHAEWIIKNCPDEKLVLWVLKVPDFVTADQFESLMGCFLQKVKRNPKNANVAGNAAHFVWLRDLQLTKKLLKRARRLAPDHYKWSSLLCFICSYEARLNNDTKIAAKAFKTGDKFIRRFEKIPHHRAQVFEVITHLCELALKMDDLKRSNKYIKEMNNAEFDFLSPYKKHYYRGLLAVKEGNIKRAKAQLLKFALKGGRLGDFRLANQLLELGERHTVLRYLELRLLEHFNDEQQKLVVQWIKQLRDGEKVTLGFPGVFVSPLWDF